MSCQDVGRLRGLVRGQGLTADRVLRRATAEMRGAVVCIPSILDTLVERSSSFSSTRSTVCLRVFVLSASLDRMPSSVSGRGGLRTCRTAKTTGSSTTTRPVERRKRQLRSTRKSILQHRIRRITPAPQRPLGSLAGHLFPVTSRRMATAVSTQLCWVQR